MAEENKKLGRPKKLGLRFQVKKKISKQLQNYFESEEWERDVMLANSNNRLKTHLNLLTYILPKAESIKSQMMGLDEGEMKILVESVKAELSKQA